MPISEKTIKLCKKNNREAQKTIYIEYSPVVFAICLRYVKEKSTAEDLMQDIFMKIFEKIRQYSGKGSFEGWLKRIAVNSTLIFLRSNKKEYAKDNIEYYAGSEEKVEQNNLININNVKGVIEAADFSKEEMIDLMQKLPTGFKTVFNLYAIDGFKHKEIAETLGISIGTSKSQLLRARSKLTEMLYEVALEKIKKSKDKFLVK